MKEREEKTYADLGVTNHTWTGITSRDYQAFTPALLYWGTNLDRDLVRDYAARLDKSTRIKVCEAPIPIFSMRDPVRELTVSCSTGDKTERIDFSRRLYFCPKSIWSGGLREYLISYGYVEKDSMRFALAAECPVMRIPDMVRMANGFSPPGSIEVASIGVYASDFCYLWRWDPSNIYARPVATKASPFEVVYQDGLMFMESH